MYVHLQMYSMFILLLPYEIDQGTLCLLQILQTRLVHSARWSGWTHIYNKTVQKCQVNNISGTPELDINYSMGGWGVCKGPFNDGCTV
jgi:hypothetical protein